MLISYSVRRALLAAFLGLALVGSEAAARDFAGIAGRWRTPSPVAVVEVRDCGDGAPCGVVVWAPPDSAGGDRLDVRNPDPVMRRRPVIGATVLWGFAEAHGRWRNGRLYNPQTGQTFQASIEPKGDHHLSVTGCLGLLCRTQIWIREE